MSEAKLQYSLICKRDNKYSFNDVIQGFFPGRFYDFYIINKWVWDEIISSRNETDEDKEKVDEYGYYQLTEILNGDEILAKSLSEPFKIQFSHSHHNRFKGLFFDEKGIYRVRVKLFDSENKIIKGASLEYPIFVNKRNTG